MSQMQFSQQYTPSNKLNAMAQPLEQEQVSQNNNKNTQRMQFDFDKTDFNNGKVAYRICFGVNVRF